MLWKLNKAKNLHKTFHDVLERRVGVEIKCHITFFVNKSNYESNSWPFKKKWKNLIYWFLT